LVGQQRIQLGDSLATADEIRDRRGQLRRVGSRSIACGGVSHSNGGRLVPYRRRPGAVVARPVWFRRDPGGGDQSLALGFVGTKPVGQ
jgi:hypothetical protein